MSAQTPGVKVSISTDLVEMMSGVKGKERRTSLDRLPDRGGNTQRNPGGEGSVRI